MHLVLAGRIARGGARSFELEPELFIDGQWTMEMID